MDPKYPNLRGSGVRDPEKSVRVATHLSVMKYCFSQSQISCVVEHGMGIGSTPFFHSMNVASLLSFENDPSWRHCKDCPGNHTIKAFTIDEHVKDITTHVIDPKSTLALVDGPTPRHVILQTAMLVGIEWIVEHDAETFSVHDLELRKKLSKQYGYLAYQFVGKNPETALYSKQVVQQPNYVTL